MHLVFLWMRPITLARGGSVAAAAAATAAGFGFPPVASSGNVASVVPPVSAIGNASPGPPVDAFGRAMRLVQVQVAFRHGARTPVDESGCRDQHGRRIAWLAEETDKSETLQRFGKFVLFRPGSGDAIDPATMFSMQGVAFGMQADTLRGGALPGQLTVTGLSQADFAVSHCVLLTVSYISQ